MMMTKPAKLMPVVAAVLLLTGCGTTKESSPTSVSVVNSDTSSKTTPLLWTSPYVDLEFEKFGSGKEKTKTP